MKILINGGGNIGTTLANVLVQYKTGIGFEKLMLYKRTNQPWKANDLAILSSKEVEVVHEFPNLKEIDYIFEATANGVGMSNQQMYQKYNHLKACAQGSEKGFGTSFVTGINDDQIKNQKFVHVVSCNTHGAASILKTFGGEKFENIVSADFVVVRRSEDLSSHERLVTANVVARHLNPDIGTHHAIDVNDLFKSIGVNIPLTSSDITTPSQLMHATRFNIELKKGFSKDEINKLINNNIFVSTTDKFDSNQIFELGRRYGFQGRIFEHAIIVSNNLLISENNIKGWAFVPQEGNTILSTIHAFLLQTNHKEEKAIMSTIKNDLLQKVW